MNNPYEIINLIHHTLAEFGSRGEKNCVEIRGKLFYLSEREIRALQIIVARKYQESPEAFEQFTKEVIVYKGRHKGQPSKKGYRTMKFKPDGSFEESFDPGFFETNNELSMALLHL